VAVSQAGLADTSVFIALEQGRPVAAHPAISASIITLAELRLGVLAATDPVVRAQRLDTLLQIESLNTLPIDRSVAHAWAQMRLELRRLGRRMPVNDSWIAATAIAHQLPVVSQDADYDDVPGLQVIRV
jgi:predicted nucleic acid-binding protein